MSSDVPQDQLDEVVRLLRDVLRADLVGAYLFGSAVLGGLRRESDLDVLAIARRRTTRAEKPRLVERLLALSGNDATGRRRVELTIVVESEIRPWRYPPRFDFQYGDWLRSEFDRGKFEPWPPPNPDVATLITMVLRADRPLVGPPPAEVFDPIPREDLVRAMVDDIERLLEDLDTDAANIVLTLARIWSTIATGELRPKDEAAAWALDRLPKEHRPVLAHARAVYLGDEPERWDADLEPRIGPHVDHVVGEIKRLAAAPPAARDMPARADATPPPPIKGWGKPASLGSDPNGETHTRLGQFRAK